MQANAFSPSRAIHTPECLANPVNYTPYEWRKVGPSCVHMRIHRSYMEKVEQDIDAGYCLDRPEWSPAGSIRTKTSQPQDASRQLGMQSSARTDSIDVGYLMSRARSKG